MNRPKVLIVDDVPHNIQIVGSLLAAENYDVFFAQSGEEALGIAQNQSLTLVLMDVMMPGMNGLEAAKALLKIPGNHDTPVIFLTALSEKEQLLTGFEAGGVDYITKPFHRSELLARVKTHIALKTAREELRQAKESRDQFFSILAHDLKNPFQALLGLLKEILDHYQEFPPEEVKEMIQGVYNSSHSVYELLLKLLDWGRSQTGALILRPQQLDLEKLLNNLTEPFRAGLQSKKQVLNLDLKTSQVWGDAETLEVILRNLISNSMKFSPLGGEITVWSRLEGAKVLLGVKDSGMGMSESQAAHVFEIKDRSSTLGTQKEKGTGLGLILCRTFAQENNGTLTFTTEPGKGTEFILELPLNPPGSIT